MDTISSKVAYLDYRIYNMFPRGCCFRASVDADLVKNSVKAIRVSYRVINIPGIQGVEVTLAKGEKASIKINKG